MLIVQKEFESPQVSRQPGFLTRSVAIAPLRPVAFRPCLTAGLALSEM